MKPVLKVLSQHQMPSGQFPTVVMNRDEKLIRNVHTITPTYLISLLLSIYRERHASNARVDEIIARGLAFLKSVAYSDPIERVKVWHFNAFYPPDWEETCWSSLLLRQNGMLTLDELRSLYELILTNETPDKGVGVWMKDPYSKANKENNVFDMIASLSVDQWLKRLFGHVSKPTENYIRQGIEQNEPSLYYDDIFRNFLFSLFGYVKSPTLKNEDYRLFHHGRRSNIWYASRDVWEASSLLQ